MSNSYRRFRLTLTDPLGRSLDLTERVSIGDLGTLTESLEEDLLELTHGDIDLSVRDVDGQVEAFLAGAASEDAYEVVIERETLVRKPKWRRLFGGVLDIPISVSFDRHAKRVGLQVFSFSKLLELKTAAGVSRSVTGETATVAAASKVVTVSDTTGLAAGDDFTLTGVTASESQRIESVDSGTQVTSVVAFTNAFTDAPLTLDTPYLRNKTIEFLAEQVFNEANIDTVSIALDAEQTDEPFGTVFNADGLGAGVGILNLLSQGGEIETTLSSGTDTALDPQVGFTNESGTTTPKGDWQPYQATEPGSLVDAATSGDNGSRAFDHVGGDYYFLQHDPGPGPPDEELYIYKNGVLDALIDTIVSGPGTFANFGVEWVPSTSEVWSTYSKAAPTPFYRIKRGSTLIASDFGGDGIRTISSLGLVAVQDFVTHDVRFYTASTAALLVTLTGQPNFNMWTMRAADGRISVLYQQSGGTRIRQWDSSTFVQLADYQVSSALAANTFLTVWNDARGTDILIGGLNREFFVISTEFAGVVSYADFDGESCGGALKGIALVAAAYIHVDPHKVGILRSRASKTSRRSSPAINLGVPLRRREVPLGEFYRKSAVVTGTDVNGNDIEEVSPPGSGDSARRLELDSPLVDTPSLAQSIGLQYVGLLSMIKSTQEASIREPVVLSPTMVDDVHALDLVRFSDSLTEFRVINAEATLRDNEQDLTLIEVAP